MKVTHESTNGSQRARPQPAAERRPPDYHEAILDQVERILHSPLPAPEKLNGALRHLAKYRSSLIQQVLIREVGQKVLDGPFKGMTLATSSAEGCYIPKLLGCYEAELHPYIGEAARHGYQAVINIGTAEGYYAIGMARLLPDSIVHTYDTNSAAQAMCRELARKNEVAERVKIGGEFKGEDFAAFADQKVLVICDIEGAEGGLLDPQRFPALKRMDIIVELHDHPQLKCSEVVPRRFAATHDVTLVHRVPRTNALPKMLDQVGDLDRLLAVWEWRAGPTPWALMIAKW